MKYQDTEELEFWKIGLSFCVVTGRASYNTMLALLKRKWLEPTYHNGTKITDSYKCFVFHIFGIKIASVIVLKLYENRDKIIHNAWLHTWVLEI